MRRTKLCNSWRKTSALIRSIMGGQVASLLGELEASHLLTSHEQRNLCSLGSLGKADLVSQGELGQSLEKRSEEMMERCSERAGKKHSRAWNH